MPHPRLLETPLQSRRRLERSPKPQLLRQEKTHLQPHHLHPHRNKINSPGRATPTRFLRWNSGVARGINHRDTKTQRRAAFSAQLAFEKRKATEHHHSSFPMKRVALHVSVS